MKFYKWLFIFLSLFAYSCETIPSNKVSATTQAIFLMHRYHVSNPRIKDLTKDIVANIEQLITDNKYELDKRPVSFDNLDTEDHYLALLGRIHNHYANNEGEGGRNMLHEALDMSLKNLDANSVLWRIGNITGPAKYGNIIDVKHEVIDGNIVYLDVSIINRQTAGKVQSVIEKMRSENIHIESIVLDLRSNPGGMLKGSVEIADIFLDAGIITSLRNGTDDIQHDASTNKLQSDYPMVVLVDQYTAAGAEVIATALKDNKRALVMGNSTGKQGTMQSTMPLYDGSVMELTTHLIYTPDGEVLGLKGVKPHIHINSELEYGIDNAKDEALKLLRQVKGMNYGMAITKMIGDHNDISY